MQYSWTATCIQTLLATALTFITVAAAARSSPEPTASRDVIDAVWHVQRFDFSYSSGRAFYDCHELQTRLATLLRTLGAHASVKVEMQCTGSSRVSRTRARIAVAVPVEATEENIRTATRFDARDRLVARLGGYALPTAPELERFPAQWRRVALTDSGRRRFAESECELLSAVQEQILPRLRVRNAPRLYCLPWATRVVQTLNVEALVPVGH
jgi:hypothetical protein